MAVRRIATAVVAAVVCVGVAGCGGDASSADPTPTATASAKPTPSKTGPVAPVLPELAKRNDDVGAKAFIRFYFAALTHAMKTGDTTLMDQYAGKDCEACAGISKKIRSIREAGAKNTGGGWIIEVLVKSGLWTKEIPAFGVIYREPAKALWNDRGKLVDRDPETKTAVNVWVSRVNGSWQLREIQTVPRAGSQ